jgi:pyruvate,orthophosphate dikinase
MPGMMDTVLNLGLNDATVDGLAEASNDARFAWDSYRRFIQMYGSVVLGVDHHRFEEIIEHVKIDAGAVEDTALGAQDWHRVVTGYKDMVADATGKPFPQDPEEQLWGAIGARQHLSPPARHPGKLGHGGERAGHGVRQHGQ